MIIKNDKMGTFVLTVEVNRTIFVINYVEYVWQSSNELEIEGEIFTKVLLLFTLVNLERIAISLNKF